MELENHWQWIAGILEGEGCFSILKYSTTIRCGMHKRDSDVILKLKTFSGVGNINYYQTATTPMALWAVSNQKDVTYVLDNIYEYMGARRKAKIFKMLDFYFWKDLK